MPTVKVPLFSPVYRNVEGEEASDTTWQLIDGYTDELGYSRRRPGLEFFCDLSTTDPIPEPPSASPLLEEDFETGTYATWWSETYTEAAKYSPNVFPPSAAQSQVQSDVKYSGSYALNYFIPQGSVSDSQPIKLSLLQWSAQPTKDIYTLIGSRSELYVEWYEFFATGYPWAGTAQKMIQFGYFDANEEGHPVGDTSEDWEIMYMVHVNNTFQQLDFNYASNSRWSLTRDVNEPESENEWIKKGIHFRLNDIGQSNGFFRLYYNDVNIMTKMAIPSQAGGGEDLELAPVPHNINSFSIGLNWSNPDSLLWAAGKAFDPDTYCQNAYRVYHTTAGGTTGATQPTHTTGTVSDGAVSWTYVWTLNNGNRYIDNIKIYGTKP